MNDNESFRDTAIVTCAVMKKELEKLREEGFLDAGTIVYTTAGNHDKPLDMERELPEKIADAARECGRVVVALGKKCYFNPNTPERTIDDLIAETGANAARVDAEDCIDMLSEKKQRREIEEQRTVYWLTPGWLLERESLFGDWDQGKANETFPRHDAALMLDALDFFNELSMTDPMALLEFTDWMQIPLEPMPADLARFRKQLLDALAKTRGE